MLVPACPKLIKFKKYEAPYLVKRKRLLKRFMNKVIQNPILRASPVLMDFLSYDDPKKFTKALKASIEDNKPRQMN